MVECFSPVALAMCLPHRWIEESFLTAWKPIENFNSLCEESINIQQSNLKYATYV
ncbi:hypothetical protein Sjap_000118 [Stephania japonica]|uniref:Uncharacterized protein n=1 Tax=Stephania japonica TaxID=461633 RepID=A0AAP0KHD8_9MAGN